MRRNDRAVVEQERILAMVKKCSVCSLAFAGGAFPYVIPLNFGEKAADGKTVLYFHGAGEGIKFERLREDNSDRRACLERTGLRFDNAV